MTETFSKLIGYIVGTKKGKYMNPTLHIDAISVSTRELYDNLMGCFKNVLWDNMNDNDCDESFIENHIEIAKGIATGNSKLIRRAFSDALTVMMMDYKMERLENMIEQEVRVYHDGKLICVLVDQEIQY
jgi:hypothetical protein